jgi:hypothetical protein
MRLPGRIVVANSLPFLLARTDDGVSLSYRDYEFDLMSIMNGLERYVRSLPTRRDRAVRLWYHCNLRVGRSLEIRNVEKTPIEAFADYHHYVGFLSHEVGGVMHNAQHHRRKVSYRAMATVSSGYDSPACAALAKSAGCTEAFTFTTARAGFKERDDSGLAIGRGLGLETVEVDPEAYLGRRDAPEAEIMAVGMSGDDVVFESCEHLVRGRVVFTGFHGDKVWARTGAKVGPDIARGDPSGGSMAEFRLRVGFVNLPIPFIGCRQQASIHQISNSGAMGRWSVGGHYDRPIPRRMAEEAGIPASGSAARRRRWRAPPTAATCRTRRWRPCCRWRLSRIFGAGRRPCPGLAESRTPSAIGCCTARTGRTSASFTATRYGGYWPGRVASAGSPERAVAIRQAADGAESVVPLGG